MHLQPAQQEHQDYNDSTKTPCWNKHSLEAALNLFSTLFQSRGNHAVSNSDCSSSHKPQSRFPIWFLFGLPCSLRHLLGEEPGNTFWVAINCVEKPWEGEAEYGSQEEQSNNHLLLHRCYKGHVWPEHVEDSQTKEEHTSWKISNAERCQVHAYQKLSTLQEWL